MIRARVRIPERGAWYEAYGANINEAFINLRNGWEHQCSRDPGLADYSDYLNTHAEHIKYEMVGKLVDHGG